MINRIPSIGIICLLVIGGSVGFVNFESENAQATDVSGIIYNGSGGPWTLAGSPYIVVGDVIVPVGETLTIEPGVSVFFDGYYEIQVDGTLMAIGTETDRIVITSKNVSPGPGNWKSIQATSNGHVEIRYCNVSYSAFGIYLYPSSNNIVTNNNISYNSNGIFIQDSSNNNLITHNNISNNEQGIRIRHSSDNNIITHNNILNNLLGIDLSFSSNNTITDNTFVNDGIFIMGDHVSHFNSHTIPDNNTINGKPLYYYKDTNGISIDGMPVGGLILANCTDFDVKNLQINNTDVGIEVAYSSNILITNNNFSRNNVGGMYMYSSSNNKIIGNNIAHNWAGTSLLNGWGIEISSSSNSNIITNNTISSNNYIGIWTGISSNNNIIANNNILSHKKYGILIGGGWEDDSSNNTVTGNKIANNNWSGIYIPWTSYNIINNNDISNCDYGIYLRSPNGNVLPHDNVIAGNTLSGNNYGCYLDQSPNNNITANDILNNVYGIYLTSSSTSNNNITHNNISNNDYGIYNQWTYKNTIYHNNFINNTNQSFDPTNNGIRWDDGYPSGGNYWSDFDEPGEGAYDDYNGRDQDVPGYDGIVDNGTIGGGGKNPYVIDSDSRDNYPLMEPRKNFMFLYEGWNLISLPLVQSDIDVGVVLSHISGFYKTVQYYNSSDKKDPWKHNCTTKPQHLNDFDSIDHLIGFWIYISEPGGVLFEYFGAQPVVPQNIPLHAGWNMVGYPSLSNKNRTAALNNLDFGIDVDAIFTFDAATQTWEALGPSDSFKLGKGYWMHATQDCLWEVPL